MNNGNVLSTSDKQTGAWAEESFSDEFGNKGLLFLVQRWDVKVH